jgi:hypothetical protein
VLSLVEVTDPFKTVEVKKGQYLRTQVGQEREKMGPHMIRMAKGALPEYIKLTPFQDLSWRVMGGYASSKAADNQST